MPALELILTWKESIMSKGIYPIKKLSNEEIAVRQYIIGSYEISFNPDDKRFYVTKTGRVEAIATFVGTKKGWSNALYFIRKKNKS